MGVLSIRRYLDEKRTENTNPLLKACTVLLDGIARHALAFDREEYQEFTCTLDKLRRALEATRDPLELEAIAGAACEAIARYYHQAESAHAAQTVELRCMIEMLSQTLITLAQSGGQSVSALQAIHRQVEGARELDDIRLLRARLGDTLRSLSEETRRQQDRNRDILRRAEAAASVIGEGRPDLDTDPVTGLPALAKGEAAIKERVRPDSIYFAVVFVIARLESVNRDFGFETGDRLLNAFGRNLSSKLSAGDEVFRWRGPSFVAVLKRTCSADGVKQELERFVLDSDGPALEFEGRVVKFPFACTRKIIPLARYQNADDACRQIDRFVSESSGNGS